MIYRHKETGEHYLLLHAANKYATREGWPKTAVYMDANDRVWARPLDEFLERCEEVSE